MLPLDMWVAGGGGGGGCRCQTFSFLIDSFTFLFCCPFSALTLFGWVIGRGHPDCKKLPPATGNPQRFYFARLSRRPCLTWSISGKTDTHKHKHCFNGHFPGEPGLAGCRLHLLSPLTPKLWLTPKLYGSMADEIPTSVTIVSYSLFAALQVILNSWRSS